MVQFSIPGSLILEVRRLCEHTRALQEAVRRLQAEHAAMRMGSSSAVPLSESDQVRPTEQRDGA